MDPSVAEEHIVVVGTEGGMPDSPEIAGSGTGQDQPEPDTEGIEGTVVDVASAAEKEEEVVLDEKNCLGSACAMLILETRVHPGLACETGEMVTSPRKALSSERKETRLHWESLWSPCFSTA